MGTIGWKRIAGSLIACAVGFGAGTAAFATAPQGFALTNHVGPALMGEVDTRSLSGEYQAKLKTKGDSDVYVSTITIQPGGHGGWHSHPGPSIIAVKSGVAVAGSSADPKTRRR